MLQNVSRLFCAGLAAAGMTFAATPGFAQEEAAMAEPNQGAITFDAGADIVTQYIFRGIEQEDSGFIFQPYIELSTNVFETEDMSLDFYGGNWNSWHSEETGTDADGTSSPEWWYESDLYAFLSFSAFDWWTFEAGYVGYFYPSGTADDIHEFNFSVAFDDSWLWEEYAGFEFALKPYFLLATEFDDRGGSNDTYGEFGIEPSYTVIESEDYPVTLSMPVTLGLSLNDYYLDDTGDDETFGYVSVGFMAGTELSFIPAEYGAWSASAGYTIYFLNDDIVTPLINDTQEDIEHVGSLSVSMSY